MVLFAGVPAIESLAPLYLVKLKPCIPLGAADVPTVACILQFRNSYLCVLVQLLIFCVGVHFEKYKSESDYRKEYGRDICKDIGQGWSHLLL